MIIIAAAQQRCGLIRIFNRPMGGALLEKKGDSAESKNQPVFRDHSSRYSGARIGPSGLIGLQMDNGRARAFFLELSVATIVVAFADEFLICFVKGAFGGGFSIIGNPLLSVVMDPLTAGALLAPLFIAMDVFALRYWKPST
jgi:hypothetical protein